MAFLLYQENALYRSHQSAQYHKVEYCSKRYQYLIIYRLLFDAVCNEDESSVSSGLKITSENCEIVIC